MSDTKPKTPGFGRIPSRPIHAGVLADLRGADVKVYVAIASHVDENRRCKVGVRRLAKLTGHLTGTVSESIKALELADLIRVSRGRNGQASTYFLVDTVRPQPNASTVQAQPNGHESTVRLQTDQPFGHSRTNRSATAERNRVKNRIEQGAKLEHSPDSTPATAADSDSDLQTDSDSCSGGESSGNESNKAEWAKLRAILNGKKIKREVSEQPAEAVHG